MTRARSLRTAINLGFTAVVVLSTIASIWTVYNLFDLENRIERIGESELKRAALVTTLRAAVDAHLRALDAHVRGDYHRARQLASASEARFYGALAELRDLSTERGDELADSIEYGYRLFAEVYSAVSSQDRHDLRDAPADTVLLAQLVSQVAPAAEAVRWAINDLDRYSHAQSIGQAEAVGGSARLMVYVISVGAALLLVFGLLAGWRVIRTVLQPIRELTAGVKRIAEGDFHQRINREDAGLELNELVIHFNAMSERLREYESARAGELVEQAHRFEQILRDLSDAIIATDRQGRVLYFNRQAENLFGLPAPLIVRRRLDELPRHEVLERLRSDIADGVDAQSAETFVIMVRGAEHFFSYDMRALRDESHGAIGYLLRLQDVTRYRQVDEIRRKMISTVSHELRTPLTSIGMSLELLVEEDDIASLSAQQQMLIDNIQEDVRRLQSFLSDLLDLSRIDAGRSEVRIVPSSPRQLVEDAVRQISPIAARQSIQIDFSGVSAGLPAVSADPNRALQVFNNLLTNAIRYTAYDGTISIRAAAGDSEVVFSIKDNGPGIPEEETDRVFDRFYQIKDDQRAGGSGLGLAIVKEVVEMHGGHVWVESAVGRGSTFSFTLPLAQAHAAGA